MAHELIETRRGCGGAGITVSPSTFYGDRQGTRCIACEPSFLYPITPDLLSVIHDLLCFRAGEHPDDDDICCEISSHLPYILRGD